MKLRNLLLLISILGLNLIANAQENIVGKGTKMFMGLGSFTSIGNSLVSGRTNSLTLSGSFDSFYDDNTFVGVSSFYNNKYNVGTLTLGPEIGYAFGNKNSKIFPFIVGGCGIEILNLGPDNNKFGLNLSIGPGLIIPIQNRLGLIIQGKYNNLKYVSSDVNINTISFNFGFSYFLF